MFIYQSPAVQQGRRLYSSWSIGCLFTRARASWETKVVFFLKYMMFIYQSPGVKERQRLYSSWSIWCLFTRARASWETKVVFFLKYMMFIYQSQERRGLYSSWSIWCLFTRARSSRRDEGCILPEVYDVYLPEPGETRVVFFMKYMMFIYQSPVVQERRRLYSSWSIGCLFTRAWVSWETNVVFFMKYRMFIYQSLGVQEGRRLYSSWSIWCLFTRARRDEGCILHEVYDVYLPEPGRPWETRVVFFMKYMMFIYQSLGVQERRRLYSSWSIGCLFTRARPSRRGEGCILPEVYDVYLPEPGRPGETKVVFFMKYIMFIYQSPGVQERRRLYSSWSIWCLFTRARPSRRDEGCILPEVYDVYSPEPGCPGGTKVVFFMKYMMFIYQSLGVQERWWLYSSWSIGCLFTRARASRRDEGCILHEVYDVYSPEPWRPGETKVVFFMKYMMFIYQSPAVQERRRLYSSWSIWCLFTRARASRRNEGCILPEV